MYSSAQGKSLIFQCGYFFFFFFAKSVTYRLRCVEIYSQFNLIKGNNWSNPIENNEAFIAVHSRLSFQFYHKICMLISVLLQKKRKNNFIHAHKKRAAVWKVIETRISCQKSQTILYIYSAANSFARFTLSRV